MKTRSGNAGMLRQINTKILLDALRTVPEATLAELARLTGLSLATCTNIIGELLESGEVLERLERRSGGGRPARSFAYNPDHTLVLLLLPAAGRGGDRLDWTVRNAAGELVAEDHVTREHVSVEDVLAIVADLVGKYPRIKTAAVAVPGVVVNGTVTTCDLAGWSGKPVEEMVRQTADIEAVVENDMNFAAVGYYRDVAAGAITGLAYVAIPKGNCEGAGIIVHGTLIKGKTNFAGEIAHIPIPGREGDAVMTPEERRERTANLVASLVAVVNPDVVVLSGAGSVGESGEAVLDLCRRTIPEEHLPEILVNPDAGDDCRAGMLSLALDSLAYEVRMVERDRMQL